MKPDPRQTHDDTFKLHRQVEVMLRRSIEERQLRPGDQVPTEAELCRQFGVSRSTVRLALNRLKSEGLVSRTPGKGTFVSDNNLSGTPARQTQNKSARLIHSSSRNTVGVVMSFAGHDDTQHVMQMNILLGIEHAVKSRGFNTLFVRTDEYDEVGEAKAIREVQNAGTAGFIIMPIANHATTAGVKELIDQQVPVVLVDRYLSALDTSYVVSDNYRGAYYVTEHLIALGYRRFEFVLPLQHTISEQFMTTSIDARYRGFCKALRDYGLAKEVPAPRMVKVNDPIAVRDLLTETHSTGELPLAVVALHDLIAIPFINSAAEVGLKPPTDFAIVGFDDLPFCVHLPTPLTSVTQPRIEIGFFAGHILVDKIVGNPIRNDKISLMVAPIIRESCGSHALIRRRNALLANAASAPTLLAP